MNATVEDMLVLFILFSGESAEDVELRIRRDETLIREGNLVDIYDTIQEKKEICRQVAIDLKKCELTIEI